MTINTDLYWKILWMLKVLEKGEKRKWNCGRLLDFVSILILLNENLEWLEN
jgi:hypothetical protein